MAFCYHARRANLFPISTPPAKSTPSKWMGNLIAMPMDHPTIGGDAKWELNQLAKACSITGTVSVVMRNGSP